MEQNWVPWNKTTQYSQLIFDQGAKKTNGGRMGFPLVAQTVKTLPAIQCRRPGLIPGSERSPGEGNGPLFQYSCLENSMNSVAWRAAVHGVSKSWTLLSDWEPFFQKTNGERIVSSVNVLGKLDNHLQKNETGPQSYTTHKNPLKMD